MIINSFIKSEKQLNFNYYFYFFENNLKYIIKSDLYKTGITNNMCMKKFLNSILLIFFLTLSPSFATSTFEGGVMEQGYGNLSRIVDKKTGLGVGGAHITLPKENYSTRTDSDGYFELDTSINGSTIISVQKDKYKPFSATINSQTFSKPIVIGIEKSNPHEMVLEKGMFHLGDNNFSDLSANAGQFRMNSIGPFYTKQFTLKNLKLNQPIFLVIGSIIGIDTNLARSIGQNRITTAFASPPEVFFNGNKISEIQINGDGQRIKIPPVLIRKNQINEVTIKTGRNLMQTAYIDYDDIEFMNLFIEN